MLHKGGKQTQKITGMVKKLPAGTLDFSEAKERGFYVFFNAKTQTFSTPRDSISAEFAKEAIETVEDHLSLYSVLDDSDTDLAARITSLLSDLENDSFRQQLEAESKKVLDRLGCPN